VAFLERGPIFFEEWKEAFALLQGTLPSRRRNGSREDAAWSHIERKRML